MSNEWIEWHGGYCPVALGTEVEILTRKGTGGIAKAGECWWGNNGWPGDIVKYRLAQPEIDLAEARSKSCALSCIMSAVEATHG